MRKLANIYKITNTRTGQLYIGQSVIKKEKYFCSSKLIHEEIGEGIYTKLDFDKVYLTEQTVNKKELNELEIHYIAKFNTFKDPNHYNLTKGGDNWPFQTDERKQDHSDTMKSMYENGLEPWNKGKDLISITGAKITKSKMGNKHSEEHKKSQTDGQLNHWKDVRIHKPKEINKKASRYGAILSEETKKQISESHKNSPLKPRGETHFRSTPVIIDGVRYISLTEASNTLGIKQPTITYRCKKDTFPNYNYETK
jgi:hypothetical protein